MRSDERDVMTLRGAAGLFSAGILVGGLSLALIQRIGQPGDPGTVASTEVPSEGESTDQIAALRAEYDRRISALTAENKALQEEAEKFHAVLLALQRSASPPPRLSVAESQQRAASAAKQRATENLLAAGYSADRIEYLQRRAEELAAQHRREVSDRLSKGQRLLDQEKFLGIAVAPDFALKYEIGDAEYERYLAALKRPTAVVVGEVLKGGVADSVGIMTGDEIVTYNNKRIFNKGQLDGLTSRQDTDIAGQLVPITVRRGDQTMQMMVPKGQELSVRPPLPGFIVPAGPPAAAVPPLSGVRPPATN
jgi:hypothetical protein